MNTDTRNPFALARQGEGIDTLPISDEAKARLRVHLARLADSLLEQFPDYDYEETDLAKRSRPVDREAQQ